jgi:electron transport complex protein RnfB
MNILFLIALLLLAIWLLRSMLANSKQAPQDADPRPLVEQIDAILPQTQCGQCGHAGCQPYAAALAKGEDSINRCPPGGEEGIRKLAACCTPTTCPLPQTPHPANPRPWR